MSTVLERWNADATKFLTQGFFAVPAVFRASSAPQTPVSIVVQFDRVSGFYSPDGVELNTAKNVILFAATALPNIRRGDQFTVAGVAYQVMQLDEGQDGTRLAWVTDDYAVGPTTATDGTGNVSVTEEDFALG